MRRPRPTTGAAVLALGMGSAGWQKKEPKPDGEVVVLKDGTQWAGFPKIVVAGAIGSGPAGEYLNFIDLTSDGKLTGGDFFTFENLISGSKYEVILLWASIRCMLTSEVINVP